MDMTQRKHVVEYLTTLNLNKPVSMMHIYKDLSNIKTSSLSSILTILCKTNYFRRGVAVDGPYIVKIKTGSVENILNALRKTDAEVYRMNKGHGRIKSNTSAPKSHLRKAVESYRIGTAPEVKTSSRVSSEVLDEYLEGIVRALKHHTSEIEVIFKEFKELRILRNLVEKFVQGDKNEN